MAKLTRTAAAQVRHAIDHLVKSLIDEEHAELELQEAKVFTDNALLMAQRRSDGA